MRKSGAQPDVAGPREGMHTVATFMRLPSQQNRRSRPGENNINPATVRIPSEGARGRKTTVDPSDKSGAAETPLLGFPPPVDARVGLLDYRDFAETLEVPIVSGPQPAKSHRDICLAGCQGFDGGILFVITNLVHLNNVIV